ncbi:hypothetical protein CYMTET_42283 [Cymbomonas tetramitiformis]|uniref:Uncharacterized protein n=1 Tax=Cymbomonas tetramitiformis TaxID=36881 RepID=A0AAE0C4H4_9CHLO|nr:hypothetical protein CYMTET_42283 [Cymbomonas tetramitiformis]
MEPTHEEKEKYEALCEEYGEEESIAGLLNYVKATRGSISAASPTHIGEGAQRGAMFDAPIKLAKEQKWCPILKTSEQHDAYNRLVKDVAEAAGFDAKRDATIEPFIRSRVRADVGNFKNLYRYGKWEKKGKQWVLITSNPHPYSGLKEAEGLTISANSDKAKKEALEAAGITLAALPSTAAEVEEESLEAINEFCFEAWEEEEEEPEEEKQADDSKGGASKGKKRAGPNVEPPPAKSPKKGTPSKASPKKGTPSKAGNTTAPADEEAADQADLATRYPVGKEVYLYARPTESDEALITSQILEPKDYFTPNPPLTLKKTVPLLAGTISACELNAETVHGQGKAEVKLPAEYLSIKVKKFNTKKTGQDEWYTKSWKCLKHILSSTDKHVSEDERTKNFGKDTEKYFEEFLRGEKQPKDLNLVLHGKYVRFGMLEHAFHGPPKGDDDTE